MVVDSSWRKGLRRFSYLEEKNEKIVNSFFYLRNNDIKLGEITITINK